MQDNIQQQMKKPTALYWSMRQADVVGLTIQTKKWVTL